MDHAGIDNNKHSSHDNSGEETALGKHSVKETSVDDCSKHKKASNTPSSLSVFTSVWKFLSYDFFEILIEWVFWWPSFFGLLFPFFFDLVFPEDLPDLIAVRMVRLNKPCAVSASSEADGMCTTWMLVNKLPKIKQFTVDQPMVVIDLINGTEVFSTEFETFIGGIVLRG